MDHAKEWKLETERLRLVDTVIDRQLDIAESELDQEKSEILELRRSMKEDETFNMADASEKLEMISDLHQKSRQFAEHERKQAAALRNVFIFERLKQSPYFGRIDFREGDDQTTEPIYIGLATLTEDRIHYIYDWRAPISSLFYDHTPGPAQYETPDGTIEGAIELKRQLVIERGQLLNMFDTELTIGDTLLQQALSRHGDVQMQNIVATIQKEQNRVIRNDRSKLVVVQGPAGSGKTSAALQRVAYLLYKHRNTMTADNIVLFSPNRVFNRYVSSVLPQLGEANMRQLTFQEFANERLNKSMHTESLLEQAEFMLSGETASDEYETRKASIDFKTSLTFFEAIKRYVAHLSEEGMRFLGLRFRGRTLIGASEIAEQFYKTDPGFLLSDRIKQVRKWITLKLDEAEAKERKKAWVYEEIELLDNADYHEATIALRKKGRLSGDTFDDSQRERDFLARKVVGEKFAPLRNKVSRLKFVHEQAIYSRLFEDEQLLHRLLPDGELPERWPDVCEMTLNRLNQRALFYEDMTPYLYLIESIQGYPGMDTSIQRVLIDEAQDYSPAQYAYLKALFPRARFTALGDPNQAIFPQSVRKDGFDALAASFDAEETETVRLTTGYRSTHEIVEFTKAMLPNGGEIESFDRHGEPVQLIRSISKDESVRRIAADIQALRDAGHRTIAVIGKTAAECVDAYGRLNGLIGDIALMTGDTAPLELGTTIIPSYMAKGIEFDAVLIYDGSAFAYSRESERKLFYTACTRAMHVLHIYYEGDLTPYIRW